MKATLEFNLDEPEDVLSHKRCISATDVYLVLFDMDNYLRSRIKYEELSEEVDDALSAARSKLYGIMAERGINMGDLE
jgi:hypothetical protein